MCVQVVDARALTDKLLEVIPVCPEGVQREMITFLPEVVAEDDYDVSRAPHAPGLLVRKIQCSVLSLCIAWVLVRACAWAMVCT